MTDSQRDFLSLVDHVFLPPQLPQSAPKEDEATRVDTLLSQFIFDSSKEYSSQLNNEDQQRWRPIIAMLKQLTCSTSLPPSKTSLYQDLSQMRTHDIIALHVRAQNAGVIIRKSTPDTIFEVFEVSPKNEAVMSTRGKLKCSYPGLAVAVPNAVFEDEPFLRELSSFLFQMDLDIIDDAIPKTKKAGVHVRETRDTADPRYISELLIAVLGGLGHATTVRQVSKRIADEVLWLDAAAPWRRSPLWLVIRVVLQTTLEHRHEYKSFMLFVLCKLIVRAIEHDLCSDLLSTMRVKVAQRFYKLSESPTPAFVDNFVEGTVRMARIVLEQRWDAVQEAQAISPLWDPASWNLGSATTQSLPHSQKYIFQALNRQEERSSNSFTPPDPHYLGRVPDFSRYLTDGLTKDYSVHGAVALHDFEESIHLYSDSWTKANLTNPRAASILASCFDQYQAIAGSEYKHSPEDTSIMALTLMELWVALDQVVVMQFPLLADYEPDIPRNFMHPLLFRHSRHIDRVSKIEHYILNRYRLAKLPSVYSDAVTNTSISIRFFQQSPELQSLKQKIEEAGTSARSSKIKELDRLNAEHARLMSRSAALDHQYRQVSRHGRTMTQHKKSKCEKCKLEKQARTLKIQVHEWPLPAGRLDAESLVFELACPEAFSNWRNVTFSMLCAIGDSSSKPEAIHTLHSSDISKWLKSPSLKHITFASSTKQFTHSHYRPQQVPAKQSDVLLAHGSQWHLYDRRSETWAYNRFTDTNVVSYGTHHISLNSPYAYLQPTLMSTTHTSNSVLAEQSHCPPQLTLHEHIAFGALRSGGRTQWMNVMRELASNALSFEREEVHQLLAQAACQLGPCSYDNSNSVRDWHESIFDPEFAFPLLETLEKLLTGIEANWRQVVTIKTIALIVTRVLASHSHNTEISEISYKILRRARDVAYRWAIDLESAIKLRTITHEVQEYSQRLLSIAVVCRITYDVDECHLAALLNTATDLQVFMHCAFIIYHRTPTNRDGTLPEVQRIIAQENRLRHRLQERVASQILNGNEGLDKAIRMIWPGFTRDSMLRWRPVYSSDRCWWTISTADNLKVHCNILDGQFLVSGKPIGQLPRLYTTHPTYKRIFGDSILDVIPSANPPMEFTARYSLHGQQISFALRDDQLVVRAVRNTFGTSPETLEIIPSSVLANDLPSPLVEDYVHWLNLGRRIIEFRPLARMWYPSDESLELDLASRKLRRRNNLANSEVQFVDIHSHAFDVISTRLAPLEEREHMVITYHPTSYARRIQVDFPRSHTTFFLNENQQLESGNTRGYIVDDDQASGTMFGLKNQLVLRKKHQYTTGTPDFRLVVIPYGVVHIKRILNHVEIRVETKLLCSVEYHTYVIDDVLGRLSCGSGMKSWFYMLYLHAITSHCLPDPLLHRTGTEEALAGLGSARSFSFIDLKVEVVEQLQKLAALTPSRQFYPLHLQSMQSTHWDPSLPPLSQHDKFSTLVSTIYTHMKTLQCFYESTLMDDSDSSPPHHLTVRASDRGSRYYHHQDATHITKPSLHDSYYNNILDGFRARQDTFKSSYRVSRFSQENMEVISYFPGSIWDRIFGWSTPRTINAIPKETHQLIQTLSYDKLWLVNDLLESRWLEIYNLCRMTQPAHKRWRYQVAFTFSAVVYSNPSMEEAARMFMAFIACSTKRHESTVRLSSTYTLSDGLIPIARSLQDLLRPYRLQLQLTPSCELSQEPSESPQRFSQRTREHWEQETRSALDRMVAYFIKQWPSTNLLQPERNLQNWFDVPSSIRQANEYFSSCSRNAQLQNHLLALQKIVSQRPAGHVTSSESLEADGTRFYRQLCREATIEDRVPTSSHPYSALSIPHLSQIFTSSFPTGLLLSSTVSRFHVQRQGSARPESRNSIELESVLTRLEMRPGLSTVCTSYVEALRESCRTLDETPDMGPVTDEWKNLESLVWHEDMCAGENKSLISRIRSATYPHTIHGRVLLNAGQWPHICIRTLLQYLTKSARSLTSFNPGWYRLLLHLAERILEHQRARRLLDYSILGKIDEFTNEMRNGCFDRDEALCEPDWLLVQIEGNFLMRQVQVEIASEMIKPPSNKNTALQLNMGEGKSSVIVPIVAATLADGKKLARVVVLKALSRQMFELLVQRLSYLCDRRVYYVPFSRHLPIGYEEMGTLQQIYHECMNLGGVLVAQPEHILSLKLMAVDQHISVSGDKSRHSNSLRNMQAWLNNHSRDVLDESDEILHTRYQLIYTIGHQEPIQGHSDRWSTIQSVLHLIRRHAYQLRSRYSTEIELETHKGDFPVIRILSPSTSRRLNLLLIDDIFSNRVPTVPLAYMPQSHQPIARQFLLEPDISISDYNVLKVYFEETGQWSSVLLLRGLLSGIYGILHYALSERRWKVDYGHDFRRSRLAVPYRAKDVPSLRSEFGHPDVAITLTCLAYYYAGLTVPQLRQCIDLLYKLDNPALEYSRWVRRGRNIPETLRRLSGVNLDDTEQFDKLLVPLFRNNSAVADFFLSQIVFPQEAKTFPHKLTATSWDLVEEAKHPTTGFSGTNDNRFLLPTSITQHSRVEQLSTNARVLSYLLQPENNTYFCSMTPKGEIPSTREFLQRLTANFPDVRVLLDVGAQMLQLSNEDLVRLWLSFRLDVAAAIFFNEDDELTVVTQHQTNLEPFHSSPFRQRLDECVVYIDDAHTRGTDLKLPRHARALVTLGPRVTKDRLVQGCMRMRKLGHGQSIVFCAPPEVDRQIRTVGGLSRTARPQVSDIIEWSILETLSEIDRYIPQWAEQGVDHYQRNQAYTQSSNVKALRDVWVQRESRTLEELYGLRASSTDATNHPAFQLPHIQKRLEEIGITQLLHKGYGEEQEREVSQEVEEEREVERPRKIQAVTPSLHIDVIRFIQSGNFDTQSKQFLPAADLVPLFQLAVKATWGNGLYMTKEFARTIASTGSQTLLDFLRPVHWVVSGRTCSVFVLLGQDEVNKLLPVIRKSQHSRLHMFNPRVTEWMASFSDLSFYTVSGAMSPSPVKPSIELQGQLTLVSGQVYLDNMEMYREVERLLGIQKGNRGGYRSRKNVLDRFKDLIGSRRKGMGYRETHVGKVLHLRPLSNEDFDFRDECED